MEISNDFPNVYYYCDHGMDGSYVYCQTTCRCGNNCKTDLLVTSYRHRDLGRGNATWLAEREVRNRNDTIARVINHNYMQESIPPSPARG